MSVAQESSEAGDAELSRDLIINSELFLHEKGLKAIQSILDVESESRIWVSSTFAKAITSPEFGESLLPFYKVQRRRGPLYSWDPTPIMELIESGRISLYDSRSDLGNHGEEMLFELIRETKSELVARILMDEWRFMETHSWWIAGPRGRRAIEAFMNAGAGFIEVGRGFLDKASRKILKLPQHEYPEPLSKAKHTRAALKFVGAAGPGIASIFAPPVAAVLGVTVPVAFLFDP